MKMTKETMLELDELRTEHGGFIKATPLKVMTVLGTRPEIIRLSCIIPKLDRYTKHILVHTGQSFDFNMSDIFFKELGIRKPDYHLGVKSDTFGKQIAKIIIGVEQILLNEKPDRFLVLGDTNSALSAIIAKRMGIRVYHMEAGNRCFDDRVPEEINRRIIDTSTDIHMPYTERSRDNLLDMGISSHQIFVTGNPIYEVLGNYKGKPDILSKLNLEPDNYILVTAHRQENVSVKSRLFSLLGACSDYTNKYPVIFSRHPHTEQMMKLFEFDFPSIRFCEPFGVGDFLELERNALVVITDSGTVQEECCILNKRCVTIRDTTERPETIECGSNIISGVDAHSIVRCVNMVLSRDTIWQPPSEYLAPDVSDKVLNIVMGY